MSSNHPVVHEAATVTPVLDAADDALSAFQALTDLPVHTLRPADQRALLLRLDAMERRLASLQRRLLARLVTGPPPVQFAGAPWAEVLARRLRISVGEAERRIAEATTGSADPRDQAVTARVAQLGNTKAKARGKPSPVRRPRRSASTDTDRVAPEDGS